MRRTLLLICAVAGLAACAHGESGWSGQNAQPFDGAQRECRASTRHSHDSTAFQACMESKGWHRTR
jgi:hypothetical protein